jgi:hypothetical protein
VLRNRQLRSSAFPKAKQTVFYNKRERFASPLEKKGTSTYTKYHEKMSRKKFKKIRTLLKKGVLNLWCYLLLRVRDQFAARGEACLGFCAWDVGFSRAVSDQGFASRFLVLYYRQSAME